MYSLRDMFSAHQQPVGGLKNDGFPTIINDKSRHCVGARSLGGGGRTGASDGGSLPFRILPSFSHALSFLLMFLHRALRGVLWMAWSCSCFEL